MKNENYKANNKHHSTHDKYTILLNHYHIQEIKTYNIILQHQLVYTYDKQQQQLGHKSMMKG